jgi:hypothetical protein
MTVAQNTALFTDLSEGEISVLNGGFRRRRRVCRAVFVRVCRRYGLFVKCAVVRQIRCFFA